MRPGHHEYLTEEGAHLFYISVIEPARQKYIQATAEGKEREGYQHQSCIEGLYNLPFRP